MRPLREDRAPLTEAAGPPPAAALPGPPSAGAPGRGAERAAGADLAAARRRLLLDLVGILASAAGFGVVFGLSARGAGFSLVEAVAFSTIVFAGASQFAAAGMVAAGYAWPVIVLLTGLVNARHLLYSAALAPWLREQPRRERAAMAHVLTDESFALSLVHFRRVAFADRRGYWIAAILGVFVPWNVATIVGYAGGEAIPDPHTLGLDIVFPAAMAGLAVGLAAGRREVVALAAGAAIGLAGALVLDPRVGIVAGGILGSLLGLAVPRRDPAVPEPDELPADPDAFARPDRSEDGMLP